MGVWEFFCLYRLVLLAKHFSIDLFYCWEFHFARRVTETPYWQQNNPVNPGDPVIMSKNG